MRSFARSVLLLVLCLSFLSSSGTFAQSCLDYADCPEILGRAADTPGPITDLAVNGNTLYAVYDLNLLIYTLDDPYTPLLVDTIDMGATVSFPCVTGDLLVLYVQDDGVRFYDIVDRTSPTLLHTIPKLGTEWYHQVRDIGVEGDLMVYTEDTQPAKLLNISNPLSPVQLGTIEETLPYLALDGNDLVLSGSALRLYDISNPALPVETAANYYVGSCYWYSYNFGPPVLHDGVAWAEHVNACNWRDPHLYGDLITYYFSLVSLSAAKSADVFPTSEKILGAGPLDPVFMAGDHLIRPGVPGFHETRNLVAETVTYLPVLEEIHSLAGQNDLIYVGTETGLVVAAQPDDVHANYYLGENDGPSTVGQFELISDDGHLVQGATSQSTVDAGGWYETYYAHRIRFWSGDVHEGDFGLDNISWYYTITWSDMLVAGNHIYLGCNLGLYVADLADLNVVDECTHVDVPDFLRMAAVNGVLYLLDEASGALRLMTPVNTETQTDLGLFLDTYSFSDMVAANDHVYLRDGNLLRMADVSVPTAPVMAAGSLIIPDGKFEIVGNLLFITSENSTTWYDISGGLPMQINDMTTDRQVMDMAISGDYLYFADRMGIGLAELSTGYKLGRVMARDAFSIAIHDGVIVAAQQTQWEPFVVPADCSDTVPAFLSNDVAVRENGTAVLRWDVSGKATRSDFRVVARCDGKTSEPAVQNQDANTFFATAPAEFTGEVTFDLYLDTGGSWTLLSSRSLAPAAVPQLTQLSGVHPNPFNPMTKVSFRVSKAGPVTVTVHDLAGRRIAILADSPYEPGEYSATWNGQDSRGRAMPSGHYVVHLESASGQDSRKVVLVR
jgi:hypothetical protein